MTQEEGSENDAYRDDEGPERGQDGETLERAKEEQIDIDPQTRAGEFSDDVKKSSLSNMDEDKDDEDYQCGWFNIRPRWMQCFNRPIGFLLVIFLFSLAQSTTVNGLVYVVTTTLERRFNLSSTRSGSISSMYDFSVLVVIVFVTYFGERANKPVWLGTGAFVFGVGSFLFTLPHFLTEYYTYGAAEEEVCNVTRTIPDQCQEDERNLSQYYYCFLAAQFLHGIGASPLYTLGQTYLYDNTKPRESPVFLGIFQVASSFAPAIGFIGGGLLLTVYTDLKVRDEQTIDPSSPLWVGNWWLGFICTGTVAWLTAIPLVAFPKRLPGTKDYEKERRQLAQAGSSFRPSGYGAVEKLRDFPRAVFNLLKNLPCLCNYIASGTEFFIISCISVFGPKFVESQFSLTAGEAAIFSGLLVMPSALGGVLIGGWLVKCFDWKFKGKMRFIIVSLSIGMMAMFVLLIRCPNIPFAGVTVTYANQTQRLDLGESNITSACNIDCNCGTKYDPVCGTNNVMYYTACHAGCTFVNASGDNKVYSNCTCIEEVESEDGIAIQGKCYQDCDYQTVFFFGVFGGFFLSFVIAVPSLTGLLSVVDESQRSLSLGLQSLFYRCLGTVPGPIIFGKLIDSACMIWEYECEGQGTCWVYQNASFARAFFLVVLVCRLLSIMFYCGTLIFYKPSNKENEKDRGDEKKGDIDLSQSNTEPSLLEEEMKVTFEKDGMEVTFEKDVNTSELQEKENV